MLAKGLHLGGDQGCKCKGALCQPGSKTYYTLQPPVASRGLHLGCERVCKREEGGFVAALRAQRQVALQEFIVQHRLHALTRHVPGRR